MELQPHQQRVVEEKRELDERLAKLVDFIENNPTFKSTVLIEAERNRLRRQRTKMEELSQILGERIAAFDPIRKLLKKKHSLNSLLKPKRPGSTTDGCCDG